MMDFSKGAAWMNGQIMPIAEAKIGVTDWGLTRSDITYDVVQVWDGAFFRLDDHLDRFEASMKKTYLSVPQTRQEMIEILNQIVMTSGLRHAYCAFVTSRGTQSVPGSRDPRSCVNHFYAWVVPYVNILSDEIVARGARMKIATGVARIGPDSVDPTAKNYHWGDITQGLYEALDDGFDTVVLADAHGNICEGPGFNIFAVKDGTVLTPSSGVLEGITRKTVLEIASSMGVETQIRDIPIAEFLDADEVFISSSGGGPTPIIHIDDHVLGNGAPGPVTRNIREHYLKWRADGPLRTEINYA